MSHVYNAADAVIGKDLQHPFVGHLCWPRFATVEKKQLHHGLVDPALFTQRYFTTRPKTGLQTRECTTGKFNPACDLFGALTVCDEDKTELLWLVNIHKWLAIKQVSAL